MCNTTRKHTWLEHTQNTTTTTSTYLLLQNKTTTTRHISIVMFISTAFIMFILYRPVVISCVCLGIFKKLIQTENDGHSPSIVLSPDIPANKEPFLNQLACVLLVHNWYCPTSTCFHMYSGEYTCSACCQF